VDVGKGEGEGHTHLHPWPPPSTSLLLPLAPNSIGRTRTRPTGLERMSFAEFYLKLRASALPTLESMLFDRLSAAESARNVERASAVRLEAVWRGRTARERIRMLAANALFLQRVSRGFLGRQRYREALRRRSESRQRAAFDALAVVIQKRLRAYYSRKYHHNYYARKAYVAAVLQKGETVRQDLQQQFQQQLEEQQMQQEQQAVERVQQLAGKLHHLRSTESCPSIYNSPYHVGFHPTALGIPVEQHLREAVRPLIRAELGLKKKRLGPLPSLPPIPPSLAPELKDKEVQDNERQERWLSKSTRVGNGDFHSSVGGYSGRKEPHPSSVFADTKFQPPMREFERPATKEKWISEQPFYSSVPRNRMVSSAGSEKRTLANTTLKPIQ